MRVVGYLTKLCICNGCKSVIEYNDREDNGETYQLNTGYGLTNNINCPICGYIIDVDQLSNKDVIKINSDIPQKFIPC